VSADGKACSPNCYRKLSSDKSLTPSEWNKLEISLLQHGRDIFGKNFCLISDLVGTKNCQEVYIYLKSTGSSDPEEIHIKNIFDMEYYYADDADSFDELELDEVLDDKPKKSKSHGKKPSSSKKIENWKNASSSKGK
jgi:hypothetical protein